MEWHTVVFGSGAVLQFTVTVKVVHDQFTTCMCCSMYFNNFLIFASALHSVHVEDFTFASHDVGAATRDAKDNMLHGLVLVQNVPHVLVFGQKSI